MNEHIHLNTLQGTPAQTPQALPRVSLWRRKAWNPEAEGEDVEHGRMGRSLQPPARAETPKAQFAPPMQTHVYPTLKCSIKKKKKLVSDFTCGMGSFQPVRAKPSHFPVTPCAPRLCPLTFHEKKRHHAAAPHTKETSARGEARSASVTALGSVCVHVCVCAQASFPLALPAALNKTAPTPPGNGGC